ncbi:MAG: malectin domain-containing carbohydrate-binding protein [Deltaproteobacteria bacterium]|nr:malectin domain-containing carbohydrate-binding protein [Deltaproteobacteria bacterium]
MGWLGTSGVWAGWGLLDRNYAPKPSYSVYKVLSGELEGAAFSQILPLSTGQEGYAFVLPDGESLWVVWGSGNITIQSKLAQLIDKWGAAKAVTGDQGKIIVTLGSSPLFVRFSPNSQDPFQYVITANAGGGGTISPSGNVNVVAGSNQTFTIAPNPGYQILAVKVDGVSQGTVSSFTFGNVTANHSIEAAFAQVGSGGLKVIFAVNCGGAQYSDKSGVIYKADTNFSGGQVYTTTAPISGTIDGPLYQSERWGNFSYNIALPNGTYNIILK